MKKSNLLLLFLILLCHSITFSMNQRKLNFSFATCNILFEDYYKMTIQRTYNNSVPYIPETTRLQNFVNSLRNNNELGDLDILCFQEWDYRRPNDWVKKVWQAYPTTSNTYVTDPTHPTKDGVFAIISNKFIVEKADFSAPLEAGKTKKFVYMRLRSRQDPSIYINVINAHVPFTPQAQNYALNAILQTIGFNIQDLLSKNITNQHWIICGDFNYDTFNNMPLYNALKERFPGMSSIFDVIKFLPVTSFTDRPQTNDYIFYGGLDPYKTQIIPANPNDLIKYTPAQSLTPSYFSDHAIIRTEFTAQQ